jgi:hypothetical protein
MPLLWSFLGDMEINSAINIMLLRSFNSKSSIKNLLTNDIGTSGTNVKN